MGILATILKSQTWAKFEWGGQTWETGSVARGGGFNPLATQGPVGEAFWVEIAPGESTAGQESLLLAVLFDFLKAQGIELTSSVQVSQL